MSGEIVLTTGSTPAAPSAGQLGIYATSTGLYTQTSSGVSSRLSASNKYPMNARLSLSSACAVPNVDITGATAVWLLPYLGDEVALYDGASWTIYNLTSASIAPSTSACTVSDVWAYASGSSIVLESTDWSGSQVRATNLALQNGVYVKSGSPTRRYLGTCRTTGTAGQCEDSVVRRFVWNCYNKVTRKMICKESSSHTYNGAWRKWNNSDVNNILEFVYGYSSDDLKIFLFSNIKAGADGADCLASCYFNGSIAVDEASLSNSNAQRMGATTAYQVSIINGYNYLQSYEYSNNASDNFYKQVLSCDLIG